MKPLSAERVVNKDGMGVTVSRRHTRGSKGVIGSLKIHVGMNNACPCKGLNVSKALTIGVY